MTEIFCAEFRSNRIWFNFLDFIYSFNLLMTRNFNRIPVDIILDIWITVTIAIFVCESTLILYHMYVALLFSIKSLPSKGSRRGCLSARFLDLDRSRSLRKGRGDWKRPWFRFRLSRPGRPRSSSRPYLPDMLNSISKYEFMSHFIVLNSDLTDQYSHTKLRKNFKILKETWKVYEEFITHES